MNNGNSFGIVLRKQEHVVRIPQHVRGSLKWNEFVLVETNRGVECGKVVICCQGGCGKKDKKQQPLFVKRIIGPATEEDLRLLAGLAQLEKEILKLSKKLISEVNPVVVAKSCEMLFDRKKVYVYFVDTKEKKDKKIFKLLDVQRFLSREFNCKVELKEVGSRGVAKVLGGIGICGLKFCCSAVLSETKSVGMRMAKDQGISMNPKNLCGLCGKLKCCLRYEKDSYENGVLKIKSQTPGFEPKWEETAI